MISARARRAGQTRWEILNAALRHFADRGYAGGSVQQIAHHARVTKPTLYYHFGSKAGLYRALVEWAEASFEELVEDAVTRTSQLPDQLVEVCVSLFEFTAGQQDLVRLALGYSLLTRNETPTQARCSEKVQHRVTVIERLMRRGLRDGTFQPHLRSGLLARCFLGIVQLHVQLCLANPRDCPTRATAQELVSLFLHGAGANPKWSGTPPKGAIA